MMNRADYLWIISEAEKGASLEELCAAFPYEPVEEVKRFMDLAKKPAKSGKPTKADKSKESGDE
jgi:hypothetical protein